MAASRSISIVCCLSLVPLGGCIGFGGSGGEGWDCPRTTPVKTTRVNMTESSFDSATRTVIPCEFLDLWNTGNETHRLNIRKSDESRGLFKGDFELNGPGNFPILFNNPGTFYVYCTVHSTNWRSSNIQGMYMVVDVDSSNSTFASG